MPRIMYFKFLLAFTVFFSPFVASADTTFTVRDLAPTSPTVITTVATSTYPFSYSCVEGQTLTSFSLYTRTASSIRTLTLYIDTVAQTAESNNTTPAWVTWSGLSIPCTDGDFDITFTPSASTYYVYGLQGNTAYSYKLTNINGTQYGVYYSATFTYPDAGLATYIPINQYVTTAECVTGTPTSTCSFTYSTTTATTTDYTAKLDNMLLLMSVFLFFIGILLFRYVAKKYI